MTTPALPALAAAPAGPIATARPVLRVLAAPSGERRPGNPYLRLLYDGLRAQGAHVEGFTFRRALTRRYDIVHLHWPEILLQHRLPIAALLKHLRLAVSLLWLRARGARIVWTCHNLHPHDGRSRLAAWLFRTWFVRLVDQTIALSPTGRQLTQLEYPPLRDKPHAVIRHGHFRPVFSPGNREAARRRLGLPADAQVLLSFGLIRPYKQIPALIQAFAAFPDPSRHLLVAGHPATPGLRRAVEGAAAADDRVHLRLGTAPDAEVPDLFAAADVLVCTFADILNSGSVMLGLSLNRPVLAPLAGALPDLQAQVGPAWLRLYPAPLTPAVLAESLADWPLEREADAAPDLSPFDWDPIVAATMRAFTSPV